MKSFWPGGALLAEAVKSPSLSGLLRKPWTLLFRRPFLTALVLFSLFAALWIFRIRELAVEYRAFHALNPPIFSGSHVPGWVVGLTPSKRLQEEILHLLKEDGGPYRSPRFWDTRQPSRELLAADPETQSLNGILDEVLSRRMPRLAQPSPAPQPWRTGMFAPDEDILQSMARTWVVLALARSVGPSSHDALTPLLGIFLLADELDFPDSAPRLLRWRESANRLRALALLGLLHFSGEMTLSRVETKSLNLVLERVEKRMGRTTDWLIQERNRIFFASECFLSKEFRLAPHMETQIPKRLPRFIKTSAYPEERIQEFIDPLIAGFRQPYVLARPEIQRCLERARELGRGTSAPVAAQLTYFFFPPRFFTDLLVYFQSTALPPLLEQEFSIRQHLQGLRTAFVLRSYLEVFHEYPRSLEEAYTWIGATPPDPGQPLGAALVYHPEQEIILASPGLDGIPGTADDFRYYPYEFYSR